MNGLHSRFKFFNLSQYLHQLHLHAIGRGNESDFQMRSWPQPFRDKLRPARLKMRHRSVMVIHRKRDVVLEEALEAADLVARQARLRMRYLVNWARKTAIARPI